MFSIGSYVEVIGYEPDFVGAFVGAATERRWWTLFLTTNYDHTHLHGDFPMSDVVDAWNDFVWWPGVYQGTEAGGYSRTCVVVNFGRYMKGKRSHHFQNQHKEAKPDYYYVRTDDGGPKQQVKT
ncbi:hypothetical protein LXL04_007612 [Taraxacum kok-saghyz]